MTDEYVKLSLAKDKNQKTNELYATFTGKSKHGLSGRTEATGFGGVVVLKELTKKLKLNPKKPPLRSWVLEMSAIILLTLRVKKALGLLRFPIPKAALLKTEKITLSLLIFPWYLRASRKKAAWRAVIAPAEFVTPAAGQMITNQELLELPVDILVPAALENVINENNMQNIKAKIIIEMANGPITPQAYHYLTEKGVVIVPDILANSGGVAASFIEWEQNMKNKTYKKEVVLKRLEKLMIAAFTNVWKEAGKNKYD